MNAHLGALFLAIGFCGCSQNEGATPSCSDECSKTGVFRCATSPPDGLVVCADFDDDSCLEWGGFVACDEDETCVEGDCVGGCSHECPTAGELLCDGDGYRECGNHDGDSCFEWSDVVSCPSGETCSNGVCSGTCTDECDEGAQVCEGEGVKSCGQHDGDPCRDWSPVEPCEDGEVCADGTCEPGQCTEEGEDCVCGDNECCEGHCCPFFFICVPWAPNEDVCF